jgi:hypothetical protein
LNVTDEEAAHHVANREQGALRAAVRQGDELTEDRGLALAQAAEINDSSTTALLLRLGACMQADNARALLAATQIGRALTFIAFHQHASWKSLPDHAVINCLNASVHNNNAELVALLSADPRITDADVDNTLELGRLVSRPLCIAVIEESIERRKRRLEFRERSRLR